MSPPRGWLAHFVEEVFTRPPPSRGRERLSSRARAHKIVLASMHHRGLAYGAPILRREQMLSKSAMEIVSLLRWLAVIADHVDLCGHVLERDAQSAAERVAHRARAFTVALALVYGTDEDAALLASGAVPSRLDRTLLNLERELLRRRYLHGNPILGLLLNHAFMAIDSRALIDAVVQGYGLEPSRGAALRVQSAARAERLATLAAIARFSEWRDVIDADLVRSAAVWQVKALGLPRADTARLLEQTRNPADLSRLVTLVPAEARQRVFTQTVLVACVDGRVSPEERALLASLALALGLPRPLTERVEKRVRSFVRSHRELLNPLAYAAGFAAANPPLSVRVARLVSENMDHLWNEIRETGDLAVILARRARGQRLSDEEQRRMREQLLDVARAVPSLAFFSLPGGLVLLPLLLKFLPFDLRPSSFRGADFRAFARGDQDALTADDLARAEDDFLRS